MEATVSNVQALVRRYNECARRFKILYAVSRHYPNMEMELSPEEVSTPTDLNLTYGKLNVVRKLLESQDSVGQVNTLLNEVDAELGLCWRWFETIDRKLTPYLLRTYCDKNKDIANEHMLLLAQFLLHFV